MSVYQSVAWMLIQNVLNIATVQLGNTAYYSKDSARCPSVSEHGQLPLLVVTVVTLHISVFRSATFCGLGSF